MSFSCYLPFSFSASEYATLGEPGFTRHPFKCMLAMKVSVIVAFEIWKHRRSTSQVLNTSNIIAAPREHYKVAVCNLSACNLSACNRYNPASAWYHHHWLMRWACKVYPQKIIGQFTLFFLSSTLETMEVVRFTHGSGQAYCHKTEWWQSICCRDSGSLEPCLIWFVERSSAIVTRKANLSAGCRDWTLDQKNGYCHTLKISVLQK